MLNLADTPPPAVRAEMVALIREALEQLIE